MGSGPWVGWLLGGRWHALGSLLLAFISVQVLADETVTLAWDPSTATNISSYNIYYGLASQAYSFKVSAGNATNATISGLTPGVTYFFAATAVDSLGIESEFSNEISYSPPSDASTPPNQPPTLDPVPNRTINNNDGVQVVNLTGITSGASNELQTLTVTAVSSNPGLIPNPLVNYTSPNANGSLSFLPNPSGFGSATITVTVDDGQVTNNTCSRSFTVMVNPANQAPTLDPLANCTINENDGLLTVSLTGISSGAGNQLQNLTVTAVSSNPGLIPNPTVGYISPSTTGSLTFGPTRYGFGSATISVTVNNGQATNNTVDRSFTVTVNPVNQTPTLDPLANLSINENDGVQSVYLTGITSGASNEIQRLTVTANSSNPGLIPNPTVNYTSPNLSGSLTFTPAHNGFGSSTITVTVNDGQATNNSISRSFIVAVSLVNQTPTLDPLTNRTINENDGGQVVSLTGITSGASNESQTLTVTAVSSNPGLIANPIVSYTSPNATGSLTFTPMPNGFGSATITVTVNDGQATNNIVSRSFSVTVNPVNQPPTLDPLANRTINPNDGLQMVDLTGITSGASNEIQTLTVTDVSSNPALIPNPTVNYSSPSSTGNLTFSPAPGGSGSATITVMVNDGQVKNNTISRSFTVTVNPLNQAPTLDPLASRILNENDGSQTIKLTGITSGGSNQVQTLTVTASSSNPGLIPNPTVNYTNPNTTGSLSFAPAPFGFGNAIITVTVNNGNATNNTVNRSFTVTVNPINQVPTLDPLANRTINENDAAQNVNLTGITSGASNEIQTLTVTAVSSNPGLIANPTVNYTNPNTTASLTFAPMPYGFGSAIITVTVNDGQATNNTISRSFTVTVNPVNQPPTLDPLANRTINENDGAQIVNLTGVTSGATNEIQTLTVTASSSNPSLIPNPTVNYSSPNATGSLTFVPALDAFGSATITVTVNDGQATNNTISRSFTVTVNPVNQPPTLDALANRTINENDGPQNVNLTGITSGASNEIQALTVTAISSNPGLIPNPTVTYVSPNTAGSLTFAPTLYGFGSATITVTVNDGQAVSNTVARSFTVTVNPVNQPPTLDPLGNLVINENDGQQTVNLTGISSGASNEIQTLTITAVSSNPHLIPNPAVRYTSPNTTGSLLLAPTLYSSGSATITVTVNDGQVSNSTITRSFTVTVNPVNQPPTLDPLGNLRVNENCGAQIITLTGISSGAINEVQTLTVTAVSSNPDLIPNPLVKYTNPNTVGSLTFTPNRYGFGSATITVTVNDGQATNNTVSRSFAVTVNPVNQPPTLDALPNLTIDENSGLQTINLTGITSGASNEIQTLTVSAISSNPGLIPNPAVTYTSPNTTGALTFAPALNSSGTATITVTVNDGAASGNLVTSSFSVTVNPVNQRPTLDLVANITVNENVGPQTVSLTGISSGANNEAQSLTLTAISSNPGLIPNPTVTYISPNSTGSLTVVPNRNTFGTATITVTVNDGQATNNTLSRSFIVTVNQVIQPPTLDPLANLTINENDGLHTMNLTGISSGGSNGIQTLTVTAVSSNPALIPNPMVSYTSPNKTGTLSLAPTLNSIGKATITVTVNAGQAAQNIVSRTFNVTVAPAPAVTGSAPPTLDPISDQVVGDGSAQTVSLSGISSGEAGLNQPLTITAASSDPNLIPNPTVNYISPNVTGSLSLTANTPDFASVTITVSVSSVGGTISRSFAVLGKNQVVGIGSAVMQAGQSTNLPVTISSGVKLASLDIVLATPPGRLTNFSLQALSAEVDPSLSTITAQNEGTWLIHLAAKPAQDVYGSETVAQLAFSAPEGQSSGSVRVDLLQVTATTIDGGQISLLGRGGRVIVVAKEPLLEAIRNPDGTRVMVVYAPPASIYTVEYTTNLADSSSWVRLFQGASVTMVTQVSGLDPSLDRVFYRAVVSSN